VFFGMVLAHRGRAREGLEILEGVERAQVKIFGEDNSQTAKTRAFMVYALGQVGRQEEAVALGKKVWESHRADATGGNMIFCDMMADLATVEVELKRCDDAERLCREVAGILAVVPPRPYTLSRIRIALARALAGKGQFADAERELVQNEAMLAACAFDVREQRRLTATAFAAIYDAWGKPDQARAWRTKFESLPRPE
jgi:hypothetical protein